MRTDLKFKIAHSLKFALALTFPALLSACVSSNHKGDKGGGNEVFVLGSLHTAMLSHPDYTLREFVAAIDGFRPDLILTEARMDHPGPIEGSVDGGVEQSLVYAYGTLTNVPVTAVDWFENDLLDKVRAESAKEPAALKKKVAPLNRQYDRVFRTASFFDLQSSKTQNLVRKIYTTYEQGGSTLSLKRHQKICENITAQLGLLHDKKVVIVFGLDHKYYIEDCVRKLGAKVATADSFLDPQKIKTFVFPEPLKEQTVTNISTAGKYLQQELARGKYKGAMKAQLQSKLESFPDWIQAVSSF